MRIKTILAALGLSITANLAGADGFKSPDVLILGDSQISFGSGPAFVDFFDDLTKSCAPSKRQARALKRIGKMNVGVIGVRSTSLHSWAAKSGKAKGMICDVDPKWKVNAGTYGVVNRTDNQYVQIGQGAQYQFCEKGRSAFQSMLRPGYYEPKLLLMTFLGNSSKTWIEEPEKALADVQRMEAQIPPDLPCIFMTTAPGYTKKINDRRRAAQDSIRKAFKKAGSRCTFVSGLTPGTEALNEGNAKHFRRKKSGQVKDPFHPNKAAARKYLAELRAPLCAAIIEQLDGMKTASLIE